MARFPLFALLATLGTIAFVGTLASMALSPFFPNLSTELGIPVALLGQLPAITMLLAAGLGLVLGPLADVMGYRRLLAIGMGAVLVTALLTLSAASYAVLVVAAIVAAVNRATLFPLCYAIAGSRLAPESARRAISGVQMTAGAAVVVGIPLLTTVAALLEWRGAFGLLAVLAIPALLLARFVLPPDPPRGRRRARPAEMLRAYAPLLRDPPLLGIYGAIFSRTAAGWLIVTYLGAFLVSERGLDTQQVGIAFALVGVGHILGSGLAGGRVGRLPLRPLLGGANLTFGTLAGASLLLPLDAVLVVAVLTVALIGNGVCEVTEATLLARETAGGQGTTMTLLGSASNLGAAAGSGLGGLLLALGGFPLLALAAPLAGLAGALALWTLRRRQEAPTSVSASADS